MKIRPKIQKFEEGKNLWYERYIGKDYDPSLYEYDFDTDHLVAIDGDNNNILAPWVSNTAGYDKGRYTPTSGHGPFGKEGSHFKYTKKVEEFPYYNNYFGNKLIDETTGNFTPLGEAWAKAVDALLPPNHPAKFFDENKKLKTSWVVHTKDSHNRLPRTYTSLKNYVNYVRNDQILGARHNVFLNKGKRYFYKDKDGKEHWVDPKQLDGMNVSAKPVRSSWNNDHTVFWEDYELTGEPSAKSPSNDSTIDGIPFPEVEVKTPTTPKLNIDISDALSSYVDAINHNKNTPNNRKGIFTIFNNPNLYAAGRLAGSLISNARIYNEALKGIKPELKQTYYTHRQVVGDEATKQAYYRRAAQGQTKAAQPFTSDADRQMAYQYEAKRIGDELRAQGDLADNQEIRRTSDESNQHQWANTQRATEVANANIASLVRTDALKHNLLAQKYAANWTSVDNFLQGLETRSRQQAEQKKALNDQIYALSRAREIENDPELLELQEEYDAASKKPENQKPSSGGYKVVDHNAKEIRDIENRIKNRQLQLQIETYQGLERMHNSGGFFFGKSGMKLTKKKKDDLLYKSARDSVEHFIKLSKISSDAQNRKKPKIEKLAPHPKGSTKKYQQGGVAPFVIYKPVALGGETTTSTQTGTSSTSKSSSSKSEGQDMLKELFKLLQAEGIPSDVNTIFASVQDLIDRRKAFGSELSSDDIQSLYLQSIQQMNTIKFNKALYDKAYETVEKKEAISEFAVDQYGRIAVQTEDHKIKYKKPSEIDLKKDNPLRNGDLLHLRAFSNAFDNNMIQVAANATSMKEISEFLKAQLPKIESNEIEGYTKKDANLIRQGIQVLKDAPEGDYKFDEKSNKEQAELALNYLYKILPNNMKALLEINSGGKAKNLIAELIGTQRSDTFKLDAVTGKAAKDKDSDSVDKIKSNPLLAMQREIGGTPVNYSIVTRDSNTKLSVDGTGYPALNKVKNDMSIEQMLSTSELDQIVSSKSGITFGDQQINPENLKDIMYSNTGRNAIVTLPCKVVNGTKQVNLAVIQEYEKAEQEALKVAERGTEEFQRVLGQKLKDAHLDSLLTSDGKPNKNMFSQFLIVEGYATDKIAFDNKKSQYIEKVSHPDSSLESRINAALSTDNKNSNYKIDVKDKFALFELTYNDVYRGTVFIPINNNPAAALLNESLNVQQSTNLEELYQISNKSSKYIKDNSY